MSRMDGRRATVECDGNGRLASVQVAGEHWPWEVIRVVSHWREWLGALDGEPERDIWHVLTRRGGCELHGLCPLGAEENAPPAQWILFRWDD